MAYIKGDIFQSQIFFLAGHRDLNFCIRVDRTLFSSSSLKFDYRQLMSSIQFLDFLNVIL